MLTIVAEYLYTTYVPKFDSINIAMYYYAPLSLKNLSFAKHNMVLQLSYPITPLLSFSLAGMYMPNIEGYYFAPTVSYSLHDNLDAALTMQSFFIHTNWQQLRFSLAFLRIKYFF